jgi:hypothetical protein
MTNNITIVSFDPLITMALIERKTIKAIIEKAIKTAIEEAEKNHRVYKLDELLDELDNED